MTKKEQEELLQLLNTGNYKVNTMVERIRKALLILLKEVKASDE